MRVTDFYPKEFADELLRIAKIDKDWCKWEFLNDKEYHIDMRAPIARQMYRFARNGPEMFGAWAASRWLLDGPKLFRSTKAQQQAMEKVDVNILLEEYSQPYPAIMVELDYPPFVSSLCFWNVNILVCSLHTKDHQNEIVTTVAKTDRAMELSLLEFDDECKFQAASASMALRIACNCCLALSHYGCHLDYLLPKEVESDKRLGKEQSERGERARSRLKLATTSRRRLFSLSSLEKGPLGHAIARAESFAQKTYFSTASFGSLRPFRR